MRNLLPLLQMLLVATILIWDVALTARIVQVRNLPRPFVAITAIAGFLLLPSLVIHLATTSSITGRAVTQVDWLWPFTLCLFAIQALYAALRRLVNPFIGFFITAYDILIATDGVLRAIAASGQVLNTPALIFLAATTGAFSVALTSSTVISSPFFVLVPMIAPAFPALRRATATFRLFLALVAGAWVVLFISQLTQADQAAHSYRIHDPTAEKLQARPTLDLLRRDSTELIVTMGYPRQLFSFAGRSFNDTRRLETIERVVRRLHPDILLPAEDPYDSGTRAAGERAPQYWESFLTRASAIAKRADRRVRIGVSASAYDRRDSTLYAWAAARGSPVDVVGFSLFPSRTGVRTLDAATHAADRWMREANSSKDHWVFAAGGYPEAHGEASQERALWSALAWGTSRPQIKGLIVSEAGDYGTITGLRAPDGHLRRATFAVMTAMRGLRETQPVAPTLRVQQ